MSTIRLTVRQLEYFDAVVRTGSATAAAKECHVSQAGLSAGIAQLEAALGAQLFVRQKSRNLSLTPIGRAIRDEVHPILDQLQELESGAKYFGNVLSGNLRLGCSDTLSPMLLPALAQEFTQKHPELRMSFFEGPPSAIEAELRAGRVEGILSYKLHVSHDLDHQILGSHPLYVALHPEHPLAGTAKLTLDMLIQYPYILLDQEPIATLIRDLLRRAGSRSEPLLTSRSIETIRSCVARGLGFTITGARPPQDISFEGRPIIFRYLDIGQEMLEIVLCTTPGNHVTRRISSTIKFLQNLLNGKTTAVLDPCIS